MDFVDDGDLDEVDYAKQVEPEIERKSRYFSLAVITFTAFTFNLSFSIILTSAKPYLDQVLFRLGSHCFQQSITFGCHRWILMLEHNFWVCLSLPSHWPNSSSVHCLAF